jgi:hypothetical protein
MESLLNITVLDSKATKADVEEIVDAFGVQNVTKASEEDT